MRPATAAIGRENEPTQIVSFGLNADVETTMQRKFDDGADMVCLTSRLTQRPRAGNVSSAYYLANTARMKANASA